jgi:Leucine-rich repeat (LRR) protein
VRDEEDNESHINSVDISRNEGEEQDVSKVLVADKNKKKRRKRKHLQKTTGADETGEDSKEDEESSMIEMIASPNSQTTTGKRGGGHGYDVFSVSNDSHSKSASLPFTSFPFDIPSSLHIMDLSYNSFTSLDDRLNMFSSLLSLNLSHNSLSSISDLAFTRLKSLSSLDLSYNSLVDLPFSLSECGSSLTSLNLSYNSLSFLPKCLCRCLKLLRFDVSHNSLLELDGKVISMFYDLEDCDFSYNYLSSLPAMFYLMKRLISCNLSNNRISYISDDLSNWQALQSLNLSTNFLSFLPVSIGLLKGSLQFLLLDHNQLKELPTTIYQLTKLQQLTLQFNEIEQPAYLLYSLPALRHVDLSHNHFEYQHDKVHHYIYVKTSSPVPAFLVKMKKEKERIAQRKNEKEKKKHKKINEMAKDGKNLEHPVKKEEETEETKAKEKEKEKEHDVFQEMIFDIPHIRRECVKLRDHYDIIMNDLPNKEHDHYHQIFTKMNEETEGESDHQEKEEKVDNNKKNSPDNRELFLKWLKQLRLHFNFSSDLPENDTFHSLFQLSKKHSSKKQSTTISNTVQHLNTAVNNLPSSQSLSYSFSYSSSMSEKDKSKERGLSIQVDDTNKSSTNRFFSSFSSKKDSTEATTKPPIASTTMKKFSVSDSVDNSSSFIVNNSNSNNRRKSSLVASDGKLIFDTPNALNQFFLYHLLSKWHNNSFLRNRYLLTHFQLLSNRPLHDYNHNINNPIQYLPSTSSLLSPSLKMNENDKNDEKEGSRPYHYSKKKSLLEQNLAIAGEKKLENRLFGKKKDDKVTVLLPSSPLNKKVHRTIYEKENDDDEQEGFLDKEEREKEEKEAEAKYEKSKKLLEEVFFYGSELFPIIDYCCELLSLTNIFIFQNEIDEMKDKHKAKGQIGNANLVFPGLKGAATQQQQQQEFTASGIRGDTSPSRLASPPNYLASPTSPGSENAFSPSASGVLSPISGGPGDGPLSPSDSTKGKTGRSSLFSSANKAKRERRVTDTEKILSKKLQSFQNEMAAKDGIAAGGEGRKEGGKGSSDVIPEVNLVQLMKENNNDPHAVMNEIISKYGNALEYDILLYELLLLHYQHFLPSLFPALSTSSFSHFASDGGKSGDNEEIVAVDRDQPLIVKGLFPSIRSSSSSFLSSASSSSAKHDQTFSGFSASQDSSSTPYRSRSLSSFAPLSTNILTSPPNELANAPFSTQMTLSAPSFGMINTFLSYYHTNQAERRESTDQSFSSQQNVVVFQSNIFNDHLPIMSLPLSLLHHQDKIIRQRYLSSSFGESMVPLNDIQLQANKKKLPHIASPLKVGKGKDLAASETGKKKEKPSLFKELPFKNSVSEGNNSSDYRSRYAMLTEQSFQDNDPYGQHSIASALLEIYSLLSNCLLKHVEYIEKMMRNIERQFIHSRIIEETSAFHSISKPFSFISLFSSIELSQRSFYYFPRYLSEKEKQQRKLEKEKAKLKKKELLKKKEEENRKTMNKANERNGTIIQKQSQQEKKEFTEEVDPNAEEEADEEEIEKEPDFILEKKEDYDDIFYDIYYQLNMNTINQQKSKEKKSNSSLSSQRTKMIEEFLKSFYASFSLESIGITDNKKKKDKEEKDQPEAEDEEEEVNNNEKKGNSASSVMSNLSGEGTRKEQGSTIGGRSRVDSAESVDSFFSLASGVAPTSSSSSSEEFLTSEEANEWLELLNEYRTLMYLFILQCLENCKEIYSYRGFSPALILQYYHSKTSFAASPLASSSTHDEHSLLLSIIRKDLQFQDFSLKNANLFGMKVLSDSKSMNSLLNSYRFFILNYGKVFQGLGIYATAIECYYQYIQLSKGLPLSKEFYLSLVKIYLCQGNYYKANQIINLIIKRYIMKNSPFPGVSASPMKGGGGNNSVGSDFAGGSSIEGEEDDDLGSISSLMTYTPVELLTIDREVAILYYYILSQYDTFQDVLQYNLNTSIPKIEKSQAFQSSFHQKKPFFSNLNATINDDYYLYKIKNIEKLVITNELSHENLYGRNLQDKGYLTFLETEKKKKEEIQKSKDNHLQYRSEIGLIKSKALLVLDNELITSLLK